MSLACSGVYVTWASPSLPQLTSNESPIGITITPEEGSWIVSSYYLGNILGSCIGGILIHKLGPKQCLLFSALPYVVGWIIIIFAKSSLMLIIAQSIAGNGGGISSTVLPVYIAEIADKDIRGKLGVLGFIVAGISSCTVLVVGPFVSFRSLGILCSLFPLLFFATFYFVPESPYYLVKTDKKEAAVCSLKRLANSNTEEKLINMHLEEIENTVQYDMKNGTTFWEFVSKKNYRKSLFVMLGIKLLRSFNGAPAIDAYKQTIIESSNSSITPGVSSIIFGLVTMLAVLACAFLVDKIGRKLLVTITALGCALALMAEGAYFYLQELHVDIKNLSWLPTTALSVFLFLNNMGVSTLVLVLMGELFATSIKGIAVAVFGIFTAILNFTILKCFEPLSDIYGTYTLFWMFAIAGVLGAMFVLLFLPETKGKSFMEIQKKLNKNSENI